MMAELCDRGPDSAGFAIYGRQAEQKTKICLAAGTPQPDWRDVDKRLGTAIGAPVTVKRIEDHAILVTSGDGDAARKWLIDNVPDATVLSQGHAIEIFKGVGDPRRIALRLDLEGRAGSHAIAHTRMATESAVTIAGSHPFSTGSDTCLVHNGSLSNHNQLRERLEARGERFQTENDSEVAAGYLSWRMREGDTLKGALGHALEDLDGLYTFVVGTRDAVASCRRSIPALGRRAPASPKPRHRLWRGERRVGTRFLRRARPHHEPHRAQRGGQEHRAQPLLRLLQARLGNGESERQGDLGAAGTQDRTRRSEPIKVGAARKRNNSLHASAGRPMHRHAINAAADRARRPPSTARRWRAARG
jgi:amidophosphoribosyltransferase